MSRNGSDTQQASNLYDVLQVSPSASQDVIHAAYRTLARGLHPDTNRTAEAALRMQQLNVAYHVLGDNARRADYDLQRARSTRAVPRTDEPPAGVVRGRPRPHSPRRIEDERATRASVVPTAVAPRPRIIVVVALIVVFVLAVGAVMWVAAQLLDQVPDAVLDVQAAQPFLNRA